MLPRRGIGTSAGCRPAGTAAVRGLCGAAGAVGDCRTSHEHRSNRRRSELLGQELVHLDGIFHLNQPLHPLPSQSLECRADPVRSSCPRHYSCGKVNVFFLILASCVLLAPPQTERQYVDDVWEDMNVYQLLQYVLGEMMPKSVERDQKSVTFLDHVTDVFLPGQDGVEDDTQHTEGARR